MPTFVADHHLKDFDQWFKLFSGSSRPIGRWRVMRGVDDPNRVRVVAEVEPSEVDALKQFIESEETQARLSKIKEISTSPSEYLWLDEVKVG